MSEQRHRTARRRRRRSRPSASFADRLGTAATRPTPSRPEPGPGRILVIPPGESRYQRRSAGLPSIDGSRRLRDDTDITVDLTVGAVAPVSVDEN